MTAPAGAPLPTPHSTAAVVGAGLAGCTAAYRLRRAGFATTLFEAGDRVGGRTRTLRRGEFLMDLGAPRYPSSYRDAIYLVNEIGLGAGLSERPVTGGLARAGRCHHLEHSRPVRAALATGALSRRGKARALRLARDVAARAAALDANAHDELAALDTETVREYAERRLDDELLRYLVQPLIGGLWGADDADTSVALLFWTLRHLIAATVYNLAGGVAELPERLAALVDTELGCPVRNVTDTGAAVEVSYAGAGEAEHTRTFDACVVATTARPAVELYPQMDEPTRDLYGSARYRRMGVVGLGLSRRPADPATYLLVPPAEDPDTVAVIADHHKAPGRAPVGKGLLTVLLSHDYLERTADLTDEQVLAHALDRAGRYHPDLGDPGALLEEHAVVRWAESMPVVGRGRLARIADYRHRIDRGARVQFAGDLDQVPGLNGAVVSGTEAAARVAGRFPEQVRAATSRSAGHHDPVELEAAEHQAVRRRRAGLDP